MTPPDFHAVLSALQLQPDGLADTEGAWPQTCDTIPPGGPPCLDPDRVRVWRRYCRIDEALEPRLISAAKRIAIKAPLRLLFWHLYRQLFVDPKAPATGGWPRITALGPDHGLFYVLIAQAMVPLVQNVHAAENIDPQITRDTCRQVSCFMGYHATGCDDQPGIFVEQLDWLRLYVAGRLFRLGRLEYMLQPAQEDTRIFRHRRRATVVMMMSGDIPLDAEGYALTQDANGAVCRTDLAETDEGWTGHLVDPKGVAEASPTTLARADWAPVIAPGDEWIDMHIPAGGGMTLDATADSFRRAFDFFAQHRPARPPQVLRCYSWLFNPQLITDLPGSNLASVLPELYLYPVPSPPDAGLYFIFCRTYDDWSKAPCHTRLQQLMLQWREKGQGLRFGGMFVLREGMTAFGTSVYRRRHGPQVARTVMS